jgi:ribosomal protein S12 methylthiotransferase
MNSDSPTVAIVSLGCPKNLVDSERLLAILAESGCLVGAPLEEADTVVINTCGFLASARDEAMDVIEQCLQRKKQGLLARVVVAGCLPSLPGQEELDLDTVDGVIGVNNRDDILRAVMEPGGYRHVASEPAPAGRDSPRLRLTPSHTAYLRIAEGCSRGCTYCTIPAIRGPLRSKPMAMVVAEAEELIADGAVELNLIAQDTTAYGSDLPDTDLSALLGRLDALEGAGWLRLLYTYPQRFDEALIEALATARHIVPYIDMPLQHIDDDILRRMGRGVDRKRIEQVLDRLRSRIQGLALRTTFIVGFPGETDSQFQTLLAFVKEQQFQAAGVFAYSPEAGTPAARMPDQVPEEIKQERLEELMLAQQDIAFRANQDAVGTSLEVLVDGQDSQGRCIGRGPCQAPDVDSFCFLTEPREAGQFVRTRVVDWDDYDLIVEPVSGDGDAACRKAL